MTRKDRTEGIYSRREVLDESERRQYNLIQLKDLLSYAYRYSEDVKKRFDRAQFNVEKFKTISDIKHIPILKKKELIFLQTMGPVSYTHLLTAARRWAPLPPTAWENCWAWMRPISASPRSCWRSERHGCGREARDAEPPIERSRRPCRHGQQAAASGVAQGSLTLAPPAVKGA